ncbi:hypothetical protein C8T65DRAFT_687287, partial [Cerioporus squamosus]
LNNTLSPEPRYQHYHRPPLTLRVLPCNLDINPESRGRTAFYAASSSHWTSTPRAAAQYQHAPRRFHRTSESAARSFPAGYPAASGTLDSTSGQYSPQVVPTAHNPFTGPPSMMLPSTPNPDQSYPFYPSTYDDPPTSSYTQTQVQGHRAFASVQPVPTPSPASRASSMLSHDVPLGPPDVHFYDQAQFNSSQPHYPPPLPIYQARTPAPAPSPAPSHALFNFSPDELAHLLHSPSPDAVHMNVTPMPMSEAIQHVLCRI